MYVSGPGTGTLAVRNCIFQNNSARRSGGAIFAGPGASIQVSDSTFIGNRAAGDPTNQGGAVGNGGALEIETNTSVIFNSAFYDNWGTGSGGAIRLIQASPTIANVTFSGNRAVCGGAIGALYFSSPIIAGSTFNANEDTCNYCATRCGGAIDAEYFSKPKILNSILWGNSGDELHAGGSGFGRGSFTVKFSDVRGGFPGIGNIDVDPLFVAPANNDLRLQSGSPCINAGDDTAIPADLLDLDRDNDLIEPVPFDLAGSARKVTRVDMGAYEQ